MWGKRVKLSGTIESDAGYTGHHHHAKSGLILTWYRAYDAEAGRWISPDPIAEQGGINLFAYVRNNALNYIDPDGLDPARTGLSWFQRALAALKKFLPTGGGMAPCRVGMPWKAGLGAAAGPIKTGVEALELAPPAIEGAGHLMMRNRLLATDLDSEELQRYDNRKWDDGFKSCPPK